MVCGSLITDKINPNFADAMTIADTIKSRISTRAFLDKPVSEETVREILDIAHWAPSGANLQPWRVHVVMGAGRDRLVETVKAVIAADPFADEAELTVYPPKLPEPWRASRI